MLTLEQLKAAVHRKGVTRTDVALLCVGAAGAQSVPTRSVRKFAIDAGVRGAKSLNISQHLASASGKVFKTPSGWELTAAGREYVSALAAEALASSPAAEEAKSLRALLGGIDSDETRAFLTEAIVCAEHSLFRAAVVLSWEGALSVLQHEVVSQHLTAFNAEALRRNAKWKAAKTTNDLARMKESVFLEVCEAISMIGQNLRQELEAALKLRNACGHPNTLKISSNKVAAHIEILTMNVFKVLA